MSVVVAALTVFALVGGSGGRSRSSPSSDLVAVVRGEIACCCVAWWSCGRLALGAASSLLLKEPLKKSLLRGEASENLVWSMMEKKKRNG